MNKYSEQIKYVENFFASTPIERAKLARRVRSRIKRVPFEGRKHAAIANLRLVNEHDWGLSEGEFMNSGLLYRITEHILWLKSTEVK